MLSDYMSQSMQIYFCGGEKGGEKGLLQATLLLPVSDPVIFGQQKGNCRLKVTFSKPLKSSFRY
jgi:hypothetical protein